MPKWPTQKDLELAAALPKSAWTTPSRVTGKEDIQIAKLPNGRYAVRGGSTSDLLIFTRAELLAFLKGAKAGEFDDLV